MSNSEITIVLIDDHDVVRRGLRTALEDFGYSIVGEAASKKEAFAQIAHKK
ncbi:MAG: response regulator, partial [Actinobacteria bacterium]|nr:response regulator [Actinomycetota bacterium]